MHARIHELTSHLRIRREALHEAMDAIPAALRNQRPAANRWSVAEVLEHLSLVEGRVATVLGDRLIAAALSPHA